MSQPPRVAFFPDCYLEVNGVARTARAVVEYARRHRLPLLCVHAGTQNRLWRDGSLTFLELARSVFGFGLEFDLRFDLAFWRHVPEVRETVRRFQPDVLHVTGPTDVGFVGAYVGHRLGVPIVGSWHTNLHQFAAERVRKRIRWMPDGVGRCIGAAVERQALGALMQFYRIPRLLLAPNEDLVGLLHARTGKPAVVMRRGVDTELFSPTRRTRTSGEVHVGFVGRLSAEKGVRRLLTVERALLAAGLPCRLVIVGDGGEREWLGRHLSRAEFRGVLHGEDLARAYADMDIFVFPSETDTFGNVVLEAMASGVPVVAMARGGPQFTVAAGTSGLLVENEDALAAATVALARDPDRLVDMRRAARAQAERCSWDAIGDALYEVYASATDQKAAGPTPNCDALGACDLRPAGSSAGRVKD